MNQHPARLLCCTQPGIKAEFILKYFSLTYWKLYPKTLGHAVFLRSRWPTRICAPSSNYSYHPTKQSTLLRFWEQTLLKWIFFFELGSNWRHSEGTICWRRAKYLHLNFCSLSPLTLNWETPSINSTECKKKKTFTKKPFCFNKQRKLIFRSLTKCKKALSYPTKP